MVLLVKTLKGKVLYHNSPDGGWAWVILTAGFFIMAIIFSVARSMGIFFNDFMDYFGTNNSQTSWIFSLGSSMLGLGAPFGGSLIQKFDSRKVLMVAGILFCSGMICTVFSTQLWMAYLGIGVLWGCGFSWAYLCLISQINIYFSRWRGLANGILTAGSSVGGITLPIAIQQLSEIYGWRGALLILAGIGLNICVFASLMRPIRAINLDEVKKYRDLPYADKPTNVDQIRAMTVSMEVLDYMEKAEEEHGDRNCLQNVGKFISDYWIVGWYALAQFSMGMCVFIPFVYLVPFAIDMGYTPQQAAYLLSMIGFGDLAFRPLIGALLSCIPALERNVPFFLSFICAVHAGLCMLPVYGFGFKTLAIYAIAYGCAYGCLVACNTISYPVLLGKENVTKYIGFLLFMSGVATLISPPLAGYLVDIYGSYQIIYWFVMSVFIIGSVQYFVTGIYSRKNGGILPEHRKKIH